MTSPARRAKLRARRQAEAAEREAAVLLLCTAGASCASCQHRDRRYDRMTCALEDEGPWCMPVTLDHLCHRWEGIP